MSRFGSYAGQPELLGDGGDHGYRAVCRHGQDSVDTDAASGCDDLGDIHEVDDLSYVRHG